MSILAGRTFERILIIKPSSFGDVIHALPVLNGLRQRYPSARIGWMISTACADLLAGHPQLDEIIPFDRRRYGRIGRSLTITGEFARFVGELRERRFDLVVDLQGLFRSGFLSWASGASARVGFASARELAWMFYTHRLEVPEPDLHAIERNYRVARLLGFADVPLTMHVPISAEARAAVQVRLASAGVSAGQAYAVIGPGTRWETKRWPVEHFAVLARRLRDELGLAVVIAGAPDEVEIAGQLARLIGGAVINLAGQTRVPELVALIAGAAAVVMNDSGPMHLAAALGRPLVTVFGPTHPGRTGPYGMPRSVARLDLECSPCYLKKLSECPHGHRCLKELTPEQVLEVLAVSLRDGRGVHHAV